MGEKKQPRELTQSERVQDLARCANAYLLITRCAGGRPIAKGYMCPHCGSYDPETECNGFTRGGNPKRP